MRKILTLSMVAGAALMVAGCGGGNKAANNLVVDNTAADMSYSGNDTTMDTNFTMDTNLAGGNASGGNMSTSNSTTTTTTTNTTTSHSGNHH
jgi:hypothetical protein